MKTHVVQTLVYITTNGVEFVLVDVRNHSGVRQSLAIAEEAITKSKNHKKTQHEQSRHGVFYVHNI
jgi:hypothetical protein